MQDVQLLNVSFDFLLPFDISRLVLQDSSCNLRKKLAICNLQFSGKERQNDRTFARKTESHCYLIRSELNSPWLKFWEVELSRQARVTGNSGVRSKRALSGTGRTDGCRRVPWCAETRHGCRGCRHGRGRHCRRSELSNEPCHGKRWFECSSSGQWNKRSVSCKQSWFLSANCFSAPDLLQNWAEKKEVKLTAQSCTWVLKSDSLNLYQTSTVSCSLCICDSWKQQLHQGGALGQWGSREASRLWKWQIFRILMRNSRIIIQLVRFARFSSRPLKISQRYICYIYKNL